MSFDAVSYLMGCKAGSHESGPTLETLQITENGSVSAPAGTAWDRVEAEVPNSYAEAEEGMVVSGGALVAQTLQTVRENGVYDTTRVRQMTVDVPTYGPENAGQVVHVEDGEASLVNQGEVTIGTNGRHNTAEAGAVIVAVAPYAQPFVSPLRIEARAQLRIEVNMLYRNLGKEQRSGSDFVFTESWGKENQDGLGTFEVEADENDPRIGIITVKPPTGGTLTRLVYAYIT